MRIKKPLSIFARALIGGLRARHAGAQTPPPAAAQAPRRPTISTRVNPVIVEDDVAAPQVVTILHRLNGLKVFRLLLRSNEKFGSIAKLDEAFKIAGDVHTNVIAGLTLDDGQTIAAWLPEAEAEMPPPPIPFAPKASVPPKPSTPEAQAAMVASV